MKPTNNGCLSSRFPWPSNWAWSTWPSACACRSRSLAPQLRTFNNYPDAWNEHYQRCNYLDIDPIVAHGHRSLMPILWCDDLFRETPQFWEDAQSHGLRHGWSQSAHDMRHNESMLSVARSQQAISLEELYDKAG
ncbi:hypothetical protein EI534_30650, partial [Pseudomonas frederiksbergensis]|nr:hypothetical protein [Pseudomonas frederiksbergensis]